MVKNISNEIGKQVAKLALRMKSIAADAVSLTVQKNRLYFSLTEGKENKYFLT